MLLLERQSQVGGAAVSAEAFPGTGARLSRYSYLVSLLPHQVIDDLNLSITLRRRRFASYTPRPGEHAGLLMDNHDAAATRASFEAVGAGGDAAGFTELYERTARLAASLWPSVTRPLPRRSAARVALCDDALWDAFIERPLGDVIESSVRDDLVRGEVLTDGLISTFARAHQPDLQQNICFLYHVIGGGTGAWDVPVGGMGEVSGALEQAARAAGAQIATGATVTSIDGDGDVTYDDATGTQRVHGQHVLCGAAPGVLATLMDDPSLAGPAEGAQVKVNLLLSRLPRLLESAYAAAESGRLPSPLPAEVYCHSLTDPSILTPALRESGAHTLTVFSSRRRTGCWTRPAMTRSGPSWSGPCCGRCPRCWPSRSRTSS